MPGCATIVGGSKYYVHVVAVDKPGTKIFYQGEMVGIGFAHLKLKRNEANKFAVTLKHGGCPDQTFKYVSRTIRG